MNATLQAAQAYQQAGYSVLPVSRDGEKQPAFGLLPDHKWGFLQERLPTADEVDRWFDSSRPPGIAIICGKVSGSLELIDFDRNAEVIYPAWCELVDSEFPGLSDKLSVVKTPRPGYHVRYRCDVEIPGNDGLAKEWVADPEAKDGFSKVVLIETRGEGGYALAPGCPLDCHESKKPYVLHSGPRVENAPTIAPEERECLLRAARFFDRSEEGMKPKAITVPSSTIFDTQIAPNGTDIRPGDDFDRRGWEWEKILTGWTKTSEADGVAYWRRPGKGKSHSATTGYCHGSEGEPLFKVFSSNASPFEGGKTYGKFRAYAILHHAGDLSAAASQLSKAGFGSPAPSAGTGASQPGKAQSKAPVIYSLPSLLKLDIPAPKWVIAGLLCEGFNLLAGKPKLGKSWMALNLAITIAAGGRALGSMKVEAGDVLYLSLEDRLRRVQDRAKKVLAGLTLEASARLAIAVEWPRQDQGGLAEIDKWVKSVPNPRLVIVDVWTKIRPEQNSRANSYQQDYSHANELKSLADRLGITILIIFHCRKAKADDVFDEVNATLGLGGSTDGQMVLLRARNEYDATLAVTGRDMEERELAVQFDKDKATWTLLGDKASVAGSKLQSAVLAVLLRRPWLTPKEIADETDLDRKTVTATCSRMFENDKLQRVGGKYAAKDPTESVF